jgi:uncharacterized protein YdaU (DUF1376 family)
VSLPWFGFNIKDFIANTTRLNTEAKGAYLMLLLDYYQNEQGPPDIAKVLATVTGLSLDAWLEHSVVVLPLFEIRDGRLWHPRCEEEIAKGRKLYGQRLAAGEASVAARAAKRDAKRTKNEPRNEPLNGEVTAGRAKKGSEIAARNEADNEPLNVSFDSIRSLLQPFTEPSNVPLNEPATQEQEQIEEESAYALSGAQAFPAPLDPAFKLTSEDLIRCQNDGASVPQIQAVFDGWKAYALATGNLSDDWSASWWARWERDKPVIPPKPKPRLEVSNRKAKGKPLPEDWQPNELHRTRAAERGIEGRDFEDLVETFRDYCAQAANRTKYSDHDGAFRTFIKNQSTFTRRGPPNGQAASRRAPPPNRGSIVAAADEAIANLERKIAGGDEGG